jgi:hypothetical protein
MGFPLGLPSNAGLQHQVIASALELFGKNEAPIFEDYSL